MIRLEIVFKNLDWEYTSFETNFFNLDSGYMCMVIMVRSKLLCAKTYRYTCSNLNIYGISVYLYLDYRYEKLICRSIINLTSQPFLRLALNITMSILNGIY